MALTALYWCVLIVSFIVLTLARNTFLLVTSKICVGRSYNTHSYPQAIYTLLNGKNNYESLKDQLNANNGSLMTS